MNGQHHCILPHSHLGHKHSSTKGADISRLLDPSYASPSSSSSSSSYSQTKVYVDEDGHFHDPDYRDFPVAVSPQTKRRTFSNSSKASQYTRPTWQLPLEDNEDDEDESDYQSPSSGRSSFSRDRGYSSFSYPSPSSSPSSYSSGESWLAGIDEQFGSESTQPELKKRSRLHKSRRTSIDSVLSSSEEEDSVSESEDMDADADVASVTSSTCKDHLRKEWASMALTVQFGVFRMKKRVKQALTRA